MVLTSMHICIDIRLSGCYQEEEFEAVFDRIEKCIFGTGKEKVITC